MRKMLLSLFFLLFLGGIAMAQAPLAIPYQAVVRDNVETLYRMKMCVFDLTSFKEMSMEFLFLQKCMTLIQTYSEL